eukprot:TRINITY_DN11351_c0_g1_i2.p1 TRINITY_DN11351_c0_g1~~TRINITY_DN11351_c0_g1_i2.p1  ORF type:complete len:314 (-),score=18.96 TRINITY_DN11351_c0_g1_i2:102-920(-)
MKPSWLERDNVWVQDDEHIVGSSSSQRLLLEHPPDVPLQPMLQHLGSLPLPGVGAILTEWVSGLRRGAVLVHNATVRTIDVRLVAQTEGAKSVPCASSGMHGPDGVGRWQHVAPTEVVLLDAEQPTQGASGTYLLGVAYDDGLREDKITNRLRRWASITPGAAVSIACLGEGAQLSRDPEMNFGSGDAAIDVINIHHAPVKVTVWSAARTRDASNVIVTKVVQPNERARLQAALATTPDAFEVEVQYDETRAILCDVSPGQCLYIDEPDASV